MLTLDELGLIHMNGRICDPLLGRFLSADPYIQAPANLQNYNRYSYVLNNPVSLTDPSGFNWWNPFGGNNVINGIGNAVQSSGFFSSITSFLANLGSKLWLGNLENVDTASSNANTQTASQTNSQSNLQNTSQINTQGMTGSDPGIDRDMPSDEEANQVVSDSVEQASAANHEALTYQKIVGDVVDGEFTYTEEELNLAVRVTYAESTGAAGTDYDNERLAIATSIYNRVGAKGLRTRDSGSITGVVYMKNQYEAVTGPPENRVKFLASAPDKISSLSNVEIKSYNRSVEAVRQIFLTRNLGDYTPVRYPFDEFRGYPVDGWTQIGGSYFNDNPGIINRYGQ